LGFRRECGKQLVRRVFAAQGDDACAESGHGALAYHRMEDSERIAIVLYVAENIALPPAQ